jgi:hypothetical protein
MDTNSPYHPENMNQRRLELREKRDAILAVANPIREQRDAMAQEHERVRSEMDAKLFEAEAGLAEIQNELAFLDVSLGGYKI